MSKLFHSVDSYATTRYTYDENAPERYTHDYTSDSDWVEFRAELTVQEANNLVLSFPQGEERDTRAGLEFASRFFELVAVDWSFERDGAKVVPTVSELNQLPAKAGRWINDMLGKHMQVIMGTEIERAEGEASNSPATT